VAASQDLPRAPRARPYRGAAGRALQRYLSGLWIAGEDAYRERILAAVSSAAPVALLDLGCHDGTWTAELAEAAGDRLERLCGVEIVEDAAARARERGIEVAPADLNDPLPYPEDSFDVVHANQVIEHIYDLDGFVSEIRRVLRPSGRAVLCTENLAAWHNVAALVLGYMPFSLANISRHGSVGNPLALGALSDREIQPSWMHTRVLTAVGLTRIMELNGFRVVDRFGAGYYPLPAALARRLASADVRHAAFIGVVAEKTGASA
jgi:SAM-dependent methyltransferase